MQSWPNLKYINKILELNTIPDDCSDNLNLMNRSFRAQLCLSQHTVKNCPSCNDNFLRLMSS